ncbi:farnesol dehydrogenase [Megachile rotundata]|uniref:farnesol dehydrogenase n=1 Tax=Megachile rotundata TaxID=143995 RepID=UPI003FD2F700
MDRWNGKVAIVTGASSGIGEATAAALVKKGVKVVGLARRVEKLQELGKKLGKDKFYPIQCDVRKEEDILKAFQWTEKELGGVDILVNNAGVAVRSQILESPTEEYYKVIDTNLIAPAVCAREAVKSLKKRGSPGHIININSIAGHFAESIHLPLGMYCPSKYGLTALGSELRHELIAGELKIKVTSISPGAVRTDMITGVLPPNIKIPILEAEDIAAAVVYALETPERVEIPEITIIPHSSAIGAPSIPELSKK